MSTPDLTGRVVLLTGATGGLGPAISDALAAAGADLVLSALPGPELGLERARARGVGRRALAALAADLGDVAQRERLVEDALAAAGGIDVLVHNAGVEHIGAFETRDGTALADTLAVNLLAPLDLARRLLPGMLGRGRGHIVMVASLAGAGGPAYAADYAATKAGQIAFTRSLRSEYRARGVSASVVLPGYVSDAGMFARRRQAGAVRPPRVLGTVRRADVADAVVHAIAEDRREVYVGRRGTRLAVALGELVPAFGDRLSRWSGADEVMRDWRGDERP